MYSERQPERPRRPRYDAVVVGSGPNGLSAAIELARDRRSVLLVEGREAVGGGLRSVPITLPGFLHDHCSAIHPLGIASPCFRELPLEEHGLEWVHPPIPLAHPLDDGSAVALDRSLEATSADLGLDGPAYLRLLEPLVRHFDGLCFDVLRPPGFPRHPITTARFGWNAIRSVASLARSCFSSVRAQALLAGLGGHAVLPLDRRPSAAITLILGAAAHAVGWPAPRGGAGSLANALASVFRNLGGEIITGWHVRSIDELPPAQVTLWDVTPRQLLALAGARFRKGYRARLQRYQYGPGVFKIDYALSEPIPWTAWACREAGTVHVGGTLEEIASAEQAAWDGSPCSRPFVLVTQPGAFDASRAPPGQSTAWAYCHVPPGSTRDMRPAIEDQIERFAPGFRDCILARAILGPAELERDNPNLVGGDITGGAMTLWQTFARPMARFCPYTTSDRHVFLCSASTPPGAGIHGMCGYHAAQAVRDRFP